MVLWLKTALRLILLALPIAVTASFLYKHNNYPLADGSDMAHIGAKISYTFSNPDLTVTEKLKQAFDHRDWRGIISPHVMGVFFYLTDNDIKPARIIFSAFFWVLTLLYLFLLGRPYLPSPWLELIITATAFTPGLWLSITEFSAEAIYLPSVFAVIYHHQKFKETNAPLHGFGFLVFGALGLCTRPIEVCIFIIAILTYDCVMLFKMKKRIDVLSLVIFVMTLFFLSLPNFLLGFPRHPWAQIEPKWILRIGLAAYLALLLIMSIKSKFRNIIRSNALVLSYATTIYIPFLFFSTELTRLGSWVYRCTFSDWAAETGGRHIDFVALVSRHLNLAMLVIMLTALIVFLKNPRKYIKILPVQKFAILMGPLLLLLLSFITYNRDPRYHVPLVSFTFFMSAIFITKHYSKKIAQTYLTALILLLSLANFYAYMNPRKAAIQQIRRTPILGEWNQLLTGGTLYHIFLNPNDNPTDFIMNSIIPPADRIYNPQFEKTSDTRVVFEDHVGSTMGDRFHIWGLRLAASLIDPHSRYWIQATNEYIGEIPQAKVVNMAVTLMKTLNYYVAGPILVDHEQPIEIEPNQLESSLDQNESEILIRKVFRNPDLVRKISKNAQLDIKTIGYLDKDHGKVNFIIYKFK